MPGRPHPADVSHFAEIDTAYGKPYATLWRKNRPSITVTEARSKLYALVSRTNSEREPITITGKHGNAVLVAEDDWRAIQETLHLLSIPGMRDSIRDGLAIEVGECEEEPGW